MHDSFTLINPSCFFAVSFPLKKVKKGQLTAAHKLPGLEDLQLEPFPHDVYLGWSEEGLFFKVVFKKVSKSSFPNVDAADAFQLFIDTRDMKQVTHLHRFCHHFYFLPQAVEDKVAGEITRFRFPDDSHPLCSDDLLQTKLESKTLSGFIPTQALIGFAPDSMKKLGIAYRLTSYSYDPQQLPLPVTDIDLEKYPQLWASCELIEEV